MAIETSFTRIIEDIGEAGMQLMLLEATEGSAGNISVFTRRLEDLDARFTAKGEIKLPAVMPQLAGSWVIMTGTGRRLRDVSPRPEQNLVVLEILEFGEKARWYGATTTIKPSSEWNSHLAIHADQLERRGVEYHAVVHAQPHYLTYLTHHPNYATAAQLNNRLLRWEPETILTFPEGIGLVPFHAPGSVQQMEDTTKYLRDYRLIMWRKHGPVARHDEGASKAADLIEYAEMAAKYEVLNLQLGSPAFGLSNDELKEICREYNLQFPPFLS